MSGGAAGEAGSGAGAGAPRPLITCIVPTYNGERYLPDALHSIFAQTYRPIEVVVVDDGSTDGTPAVIASFGTRVRGLRQENAGVAAARNAGIAVARGALVAFLDHDDVWESDKLERQAAYLAAHPAVGICLSHVQNFWSDALRDEAERLRGHRFAQPLPGFLAQTMLARREVFATLGLFDLTLRHASETQWFLAARARGVEIAMLPEVLTRRRVHLANTSRVLANASREEYLRLVKRQIAQHRGGATPRRPE